MDRDRAAEVLVSRVIETGKPHTLYRVGNDYHVANTGDPPDELLEGTAEPLVLSVAVQRTYRRGRDAVS